MTGNNIDVAKVVCLHGALGVNHRDIKIESETGIRTYAFQGHPQAHRSQNHFQSECQNQSMVSAFLFIFLLELQN